MAKATHVPRVPRIDIRALLEHLSAIDKVLAEMDINDRPEVLLALKDAEDLRHNLNQLFGE